MTLPTYNIEVTADIAAKIRTLAAYGVFAAKNGSCEIHFDALGNISQIAHHTYHKVIPTHTKNEIDVKGVIV